MKIAIHWFRRDLRLQDNKALSEALNSGFPVLPVFVFDARILKELPVHDARLSFIYDLLAAMDKSLKKSGGGIQTLFGDPMEVWKKLIEAYDIEAVYSNEDYEPYAIKRDREIADLLESRGIAFKSYKDQVIFAKDEVLKDDGKPYTVYTPYKRKWLSKFNPADWKPDNYHISNENLLPHKSDLLSLENLGFVRSEIKVKPFTLKDVGSYEQTRNFPSLDNTSYLSPHLRFGTVSPRQIIHQLQSSDEIFLSELIWREFFMQILYHFPQVVNHNFKRKYDGIQWRNNEQEFKMWCEGKTGYPMVDAGMRQLNETGYMHNRVRMITAGFLCKHLLIDWKWGEAYFAEKLLDYELSSNNGNWQWAAGTGCDAAPYFRIFNPTTQIDKFDKERKYIKTWIKEFDTDAYPAPMVNHKEARERALDTYKSGILS